MPAEAGFRAARARVRIRMERSCILHEEESMAEMGRGLPGRGLHNVRDVPGVGFGIGFGIGFAVPSRVLRSRAEKRAREMERHLPEMLDVLALGMRR